MRRGRLHVIDMIRACTVQWNMIRYCHCLRIKLQFDGDFFFFLIRYIFTMYAVRVCVSDDVNGYLSYF